jgi:hypothetical protein
MIVTKDSEITKEFLERVGIRDFVWHSRYVGTYSVTTENMAKRMNPSDWEREHPEDARFITACDMEEIIEDIKVLIPEAVRHRDPNDPRIRFYDEYACPNEEDIDLFATYQALLKLGYHVARYVSSDECGGEDTAMDLMDNRTYVSESTKEFITKTSHH